MIPPASETGIPTSIRNQLGAMDREKVEPPPVTQTEILRKMTPAQRIELFEHHNAWVRQLKREALEMQYPDCSAEEIDRKLAQIILRTRT